MPLDKDEFKKLAPEERIKKLKEIEEQRKKDLEETEDLIKKTEAEIERTKDIPDMEVPLLEPVDISKKFEAEDNLEGTVSKEPSKEETVSVKYTPSSDYKPAEVDEDVIAAVKMEDGIKYESASEKGKELDASRAADKHIKKYTKG
ncbi:hypothetical protein GOV09_04035 [Candidatus Woesearchaeota archaeon]|nr:hypothetical protein [Candidatus Woesearchaeota archaeon]